MADDLMSLSPGRSHHSSPCRASRQLVIFIIVVVVVFLCGCGCGCIAPSPSTSLYIRRPLLDSLETRTAAAAIPRSKLALFGGNAAISGSRTAEVCYTASAWEGCSLLEWQVRVRRVPRRRAILSQATGRAKLLSISISRCWGQQKPNGAKAASSSSSSAPWLAADQKKWDAAVFVKIFTACSKT